LKSKKERAETLIPINISIIGTTDYPTEGEISCIEHEFNRPCSRRTIHLIFKKHGLLIRIKEKPKLVERNT
jgi:hypothetical protein